MPGCWRSSQGTTSASGEAEAQGFHFDAVRAQAAAATTGCTVQCFGFVQTYDTKLKRRLVDLLISQGMQANQAVTFLTDGDDDVRDLPLYLNPESAHLLEGFHVTMRLTVMANMAESLRATR